MPQRDTFGKVTIYKLDGPLSDDGELPSFEGFDLIKDDAHTVDGVELRYHLFFMQQGEPKPASWYKGFKPLLDTTPHSKPGILLPGFILIVEITSSVYALTGGLGFTPIRKQRIVRHFGLTLARKLISESELRGLSQKDTGGNVNHLDRAFRRGYNPMGDSGNLKRILTHLRATISDQNPRYVQIGKSITAGDALTVNGQKTFDDLMRFVVAVDELWNTDIPLLSIPQLEELHKKTDATLIQALNLDLVEALANYNHATESFFIDNEDIGYLPDRVAAYQILEPGSTTTGHPTCEDLFDELRTRLAAISTPDLRAGALHQIQLRLTFDDGHYEDVPFVKYICGDITHQNEVYFIHQGAWYRATQDYLSEIERELDQLEYLPAEQLGLLPWDPSQHLREADFNAAQHAFVCLDTYLIRPEGERGGIEFCDLLREHNSEFRLVHVKKAHGAELRALFAQGDVSSRLFAQSNQFQQKVLAGDFERMPSPKPPEALAMLDRLNGVPRFRLRVVFAIYDPTPSHSAPDAPGTTSQMLNGTLTPFAKVDLLTRVEALRTLGYQVAITRIRPYHIEASNAA